MFYLQLSCMIFYRSQRNKQFSCSKKSNLVFFRCNKYMTKRKTIGSLRIHTQIYKFFLTVRTREDLIPPPLPLQPPSPPLQPPLSRGHSPSLSLSLSVSFFPSMSIYIYIYIYNWIVENPRGVEKIYRCSGII